MSLSSPSPPIADTNRLDPHTMADNAQMLVFLPIEQSSASETSINSNGMVGTHLVTDKIATKKAIKHKSKRKKKYGTYQGVHLDASPLSAPVPYQRTSSISLSHAHIVLCSGCVCSVTPYKDSKRAPRPPARSSPRIQRVLVRLGQRLIRPFPTKVPMQAVTFKTAALEIQCLRCQGHPMNRHPHSNEGRK